MESQESDICNQDEVEYILNELREVDPLDVEIDWANVSVPIADHNVSLPDPTGELPARTEWAGEHFFDSKVDFTGNHRKLYVVSNKLNCLYVDMDRVVPFQMRWDGTPGLYVRALMMYTSSDNMQMPVKRCISHKDKDNPSNSCYEHNEHVLATCNDHAKYDMNPISKRYSVLVPLQLQQGCEYALINYKFMCKTSCSGGINRSPTDIIFTLENESGCVLGRQKIGVKICSCPKRDKDKDEANLADPPGKRKKTKKEEKPQKPVEPPSKKIKTEPVETNHSTSFMVTCASAEIANSLKGHLKKWEQVMSVEMAQAGQYTPLISVVDQDQ